MFFVAVLYLGLVDSLLIMALTMAISGSSGLVLGSLIEFLALQSA